MLNFVGCAADSGEAAAIIVIAIISKFRVLQGRRAEFSSSSNRVLLRLQGRTLV